MTNKYPDLNDTDIAKKTKIPRSTVSHIRKILLERGYISTIRIPDCNKIQHELFVLTHIKLNKQKIKQEEFELIKKRPNIIFLVSTGYDLVAFSLFKDYSEFKKEYSSYINAYKEKDYLTREPKTILLSVADLKNSTIKFVPIVKKVLGIEADI